MQASVQQTAPLGWSAENDARYGAEPLLTSHRLGQLDLYGDAELISILDSVPRSDVQVFSMDIDPDDPDRWFPVDASDASGADILAAVRVGRFWVNAIGFDRVHAPTASLIADVYGQLTSRIAVLAGSIPPYATLAISSAGAVEPYRFDAEDRMLWQLRGTQHLFVYPGALRHIVPMERQEAIFAGAVDRAVPYAPSYDVHAVHYELVPGDVVSWPHAAPHRVCNGDQLAVSLNTVVHSPASARRQSTYSANRYLRRHAPVRRLSANTDGVRPSAKRFAWRVARRLYDRDAGVRPSRWTHHRLDPGSNRGLRYSERPIRAHFDDRVDPA